MDLKKFFMRTRRQGKVGVSDILSYSYLIMGVILMFGPVIWLILSSFKTPAALVKFPPTLLPQGQKAVSVEGYDEPLPLFTVTFEDGTQKEMAQVRRVGIEAQMVDPQNPGEIVKVNINQRTEITEVKIAWENYTESLTSFNFLSFLKNSVIVTIVATLLTLVINSMAAFALSKYEFKGRNLTFVIIVSTLLIPISVILVPVFLVITKLDMNNSLWGVIVPGAATPTGVFLLRQYMLTIPDELLAAARVDGASEWRIYWQIILPLAKPAIASVILFEFMWTWNDFMGPLLYLSKEANWTLSLGLLQFRSDKETAWELLMAASTLMVLPAIILYFFGQKNFIQGIATTGFK